MRYIQISLINGCPAIIRNNCDKGRDIHPNESILRIISWKIALPRSSRVMTDVQYRHSVLDMKNIVLHTTNKKRGEQYGRKRIIQGRTGFLR